jgi:hypothetical protein
MNLATSHRPRQQPSHAHGRKEGAHGGTRGFPVIASESKALKRLAEQREESGGPGAGGRVCLVRPDDRSDRGTREVHTNPPV